MEQGDVLIGMSTLNGKGVFLSKEGRLKHIHVLGTTGAGKSKLLEHLMRCDIKDGAGFCLIDPHGDLYRNIIGYVARGKIKPDKVIVIDPNDEKWAVGLNYLEYDENVRSSTSHAAEVMKGVAKVFGGEDTDVLPRLQRWQRNALIPLIEKRLTLVELGNFVDPARSFYREIILKELKSYEIRDEWERFENAPKRDRETYVEAVLNRANKFAIGNVRRIFGQIESTVDFRKAMDEGKIILCNLACDKLSQEEQRMFGVVILDKIVQAGKSRTNIPESKRRPFFVYLDEFQNFVSDDIARALQELRKFKVFFRLAHQELQQLKDESAKIFSAVMAETQVKISFRISREDAEIMAKEMFTGKIRGDVIKKVIEQTKLDPRETTREVNTESRGWSEGYTKNEGKNELHGASESAGETYIPAQTFLDDDELIYTSAITVSSSGYGSSKGESYSSGSSGGVSKSVVPFYEYERYKEVSSIQYYSVEEQLEKFISWIKNQDDRCAQVKIGQKPPMPMETVFVEPLPVRAKDVLALIKKSCECYALPVEQVDMIIEERRQDFIDTAVEMGYLEEKKEMPELNAQSMRQPLAAETKVENVSKDNEVIELNPQSMRSKK